MNLVTITLFVVLAAGLLTLWSNLVQPRPPPREDELFEFYKYIGKQNTSSGALPVPFHAYAADTLQIHGLSSLEYWQNALKNEDYFPVVDSLSGSVPAVWWVVQYSDSSGGPYLETLLTTFVSQEKGKSVEWKGDVTSTDMMFYRPDIKPYVHKLWLNETVPIDYGREILGYDKYHTSEKAKITVTDGIPTYWNFPTVDNKATIFEGSFTPKSGLSQIMYQLTVLKTLFTELGLKKALRVLTDKDFRNEVVTPKGIMDSKIFPADVNPVGEFICKVDPLFFPWDPNSDSLVFHDPDLASLQLVPHSVQVLPGIRFVLRGPYNFFVRP